MPASLRRHAVALALLSVALHGPVSAQPSGKPGEASARRGDYERLVKEVQEDARRVQEDARVVAEDARRHALEAQREVLAHHDALAQLEFDIDYGNLAFIDSELGSTREIVKNAPYTADAVNETVQVLQDGNRVVKRSTTRLARDTYGRTRQEKTGAHGAVAYIFDPIDNRNFALNLERRTAVRIPRVPEITMPPGAPLLAPTPPTPPMPITPPAAPAPAAAPMPPATQRPDSSERVIVHRRGDDGRDSGDVRIEVMRINGDTNLAALGPLPTIVPLVPRDNGERKSLGTRDFDGVKAEGTQTTHTIAAGAIGNERPIVITSERWFSPELQLVVFARTTDPRAGETTYRLANLKRGEPSADLFKVPAEFQQRRG